MRSCLKNVFSLESIKINTATNGTNQVKTNTIIKIEKATSKTLFGNM